MCNHRRFLAIAVFATLASGSSVGAQDKKEQPKEAAPAKKINGHITIGKETTFVTAPLGLKTAAKLWDDFDAASTHPWTAKEHKNLAGWLKANEKPLALAEEALPRRMTKYEPEA